MTADRSTPPAGSYEFSVRHAEPLMMLGADGVLLPGVTPSLSDADALRALEWMVLSRTLDMWGTRLQRMGRIGLYTPVNGQEASVVGSAIALDPKLDWLVPAYREQPAWLMQGMPLASLMGQYQGKRSALRLIDDVNLLPRQQSVGAQLPQAVGLAWALSLRKTGAAVLVYCGDGASSEGDFHEACNLAGVQRAPVVFVVQNNEWAISTPASKQTAGTIAARGPGYGFPGYLVDGNDVMAVHEVTHAAVVRARAGGGPTLIESRTYRLGFHNTSDNPNEYRSATEVEAAALRDPVRRLERYLASRGKWDDATAARLEQKADEQIRAAIAAADALPANTPADIFDDVYAVQSQRLLQQRERSLRDR